MGSHSLEEVLERQRAVQQCLRVSVKTGHCHDPTDFKANRLQRQKLVEENNHHPR